MAAPAKITACYDFLSIRNLLDRVFDRTFGRVFDQLIDNTDRNLGNLVIDNQWRLWMIDHTRAFRSTTKIRSEANLVMCERRLLANMRKLDEDTLNEKLRPFLTKTEIKSMLTRRDKVVQFFDDAVTQKGQGAVLYDLPQRE